jgi:hypothetical protein
MPARRDLGTADAWATAILASGRDGLDLLADAPPDLEALAVLEDTTVQTPGFPLAADLDGDLGHERCIAASNATSDGGKSVRRTNARASCAPYSRSMPESSHSIESGPV